MKLLSVLIVAVCCIFMAGGFVQIAAAFQQLGNENLANIIGYSGLTFSGLVFLVFSIYVWRA